ncbi:MAG: DUF4366 domain-containing protein [Lachnospiraceae bacterium]|nr:DUF4366 domain-containing protein [Lachnospiraceae bacterium]
MERVVSLIKKNNEILLSKNKWVKVIAVVGVIALIVGIGYLVYKRFVADEEFCDEDFEEGYDEDFFED